MGNRIPAKAAAVAAALGLIVGAAPAVNKGFSVLVHAATLADGAVIGAGGDGSLVFFTSFFSITNKEDLPTAEDLLDKPFLEVNGDLFTWEPAADAVRQFTATSNIQTADGTAIARLTSNDQVQVFSKTYHTPIFEPGQDGFTTTRIAAAAFRSNADQEIPGFSATLDDVDERVAGNTSLVYVWDSERNKVESVLEFLIAFTGATFGEPSLAVKSSPITGKPTGSRDDVITGGQIQEILVAFDGDGDPSGDNPDLNREVFLWTRSRFLTDDGVPGGIEVNNAGVTQITHTIGGDCFNPAVNARGEVAFVATADVTGGNPDGSPELFLWDARRGFRQLSDVPDADSGAIDQPRWSENGRVLVFSATADLVRRNPDLSSEIYVWSGGKLRQVTAGTTGGSTTPDVDPTGRFLAFVTDADIAGVVYASASPEVVVTNVRGGGLRQITSTTSGTNEGPHVTRAPSGFRLTWVSSANFTGENSGGRRRIYTAPLPAR